MPICKSCGKTAGPNERFCVQCGEPIAVEDPPLQSAAPESARVVSKEERKSIKRAYKQEQSASEAQRWEQTDKSLFEPRPLTSGEAVGNVFGCLVVLAIVAGAIWACATWFF